LFTAPIVPCMSLWHQCHLCSSVCFMLRLVIILHSVLSLLKKLSLPFNLQDILKARNLISAFWRIYDIDTITGKITERIFNAVLFWCLIKAMGHKLSRRKKPNLLKTGIQQFDAQQLALAWWQLSQSDWIQFYWLGFVLCVRCLVRHTFIFTDKVSICEFLSLSPAYTVLVLLKSGNRRYLVRE
jgi:hypothetical protein